MALMLRCALSTMVAALSMQMAMVAAVRRTEQLDKENPPGKTEMMLPASVSSLMESVSLGKGGLQLRFKVASGEKSFHLRLMTQEMVLKEALNKEVPEGERIPNRVFLTGPWRPESVIETNKEHFAEGTEFLFYDDGGMAESMKTIGEELAERGLVVDVADAWSMLRPLAYRADLWRLAVIWKSGGLYLDSKVVLTQPPSSFVDMAADRVAVCYDAGAVLGLWNGLFAARREEPALVSLMQAIVENVRVRAYPGILEISGPAAWYTVLSRRVEAAGESKKVPSVRCAFRDGRLRLACGGVFALAPLGGEAISGDFLCASTGGENEFAHVDEAEHAQEHSHRTPYGTLYDRHAVYCDEASGEVDDVCDTQGNGVFGPTHPQ